MKKFIKSIKTNIQQQKSIRKSYLADCEEYTRWNYNNPKVKTKNALEAKILRQTHVLEKGMSLENPRQGFGVQKAMELLSFIEEFEKYGYQIKDSTPVCNAIGVLDAYVEFHRERNVKAPDIAEKLEELKKYIPQTTGTFGIESQSLECLERSIHGEFPEFIKSRHSVRQFSKTALKYGDVQNAVCLAMNAPSARFIAAAGHYGNKSSLLVKNYAENLGFEYISASDKEEYLAHLDEFISPSIGERPIVFEVFTNSEDEALTIISTACTDGKVVAKKKVKDVAVGVIGERQFSNLKKILGK